MQPDQLKSTPRHCCTLSASQAEQSPPDLNTASIREARGIHLHLNAQFLIIMFAARQFTGHGSPPPPPPPPHTHKHTRAQHVVTVSEASSSARTGNIHTHVSREPNIMWAAGEFIGHRRVRCGWAQHKHDQAQSNDFASIDKSDPFNANVYVGNVSPELNDSELRRAFSQFGNVVGVLPHQCMPSNLQRVTVSSKITKLKEKTCCQTLATSWTEK